MQKWVIPCNVKNFDIVKHFENNDTAFFKRNRALQLGDEVYLYLARPYSEIKYKGVVIQTGINPREVGKEYKVQISETKTFVLVKIEKEFPTGTFTGDKLKDNGLGQFVNQQLIRGKIEDYITSIENAL